MEAKTSFQNSNELVKSRQLLRTIIGGTVILLLVSILFISCSKEVKTITWDDFNKNMLQTHDVDKLVLVNKSFVEVYIKPAKLADEPRYKDVAKTAFNTTNKGPHYKFTIMDPVIFNNELDNAERNFPESEKVEYTIVARP